MSVLVYTENWEGQFKKLTYEIASYGSALAAMLNTQCIAVGIGEVEEGEARKLGRYGISKYIGVDCSPLAHFDAGAYAGILSDLAENVDARVLILADDSSGKALAPRLSVRMKAALASGINKLPEATDPTTISKKVFSGSAFAALQMKTGRQIITLTKNAFDPQEQPVDIEIEQQRQPVDMSQVKTKVLEAQKLGGEVLLTDAEIVVSGGRGMKSPDNWEPIMELADILGAATACSRPVSDEGWRPHEEHTGQTGKIIAPNLYIAIGISGATQHLAGISGSKYIVAINPDKDAPIFEAAQYGIVGDAAKVLPKLVEAFRATKS